MMKQKKGLTTLDVTSLVNDLNEKIVGLRLSNIFDLNSQQYVFKFAKNEKKSVLIIENGIRFHTTTAKIEKKKMPSGFCMKFRKYLKAKKLESISQVGMERVVDMKFGSENGYHLILEFYAQGNIILTDKDYRIIQLMRTHQFTETVKTAIGEIYPFDYAAQIYLEKLEISKEKIYELIEKDKIKQEQLEIQLEEQNQKKEEVKAVKPQKQKPNEKSQKKKQMPQKDKGLRITDIVFQLLPCFHPKQVDHFLKKHHLNPTQKFEDELIDQIIETANDGYNFLKEFKAQKNHKGYLILSDIQPGDIKKKVEQIGQQDELKKMEQIAGVKEEEIVKDNYSEFTPYLFDLHLNLKMKQYDSFDEAVDEYYQSQQETQQKNEYEIKAWKKYENIKKDQEKRVEKLQKEQDEFVYKAQLIEQNIDDIEAIINIVNTLVQGGLSWDKINKMIGDGRKQGDPLANLIQKIDWPENEVVIFLEEQYSDVEDVMTPVAVNFTLSAFQNSQRYYQQKKKHCVKEQKTIEAANQAIKIAEKTVIKEIEKAKVKVEVINARKTYWFEKFYWFITSENYLVTHGKDHQQNELLVKRYLQKVFKNFLIQNYNQKKNVQNKNFIIIKIYFIMIIIRSQYDKDDIFMHADYHGAATTLIKNSFPGKPIPLMTLEEAACGAVCRSKAWDQKLLTNCWWVYANQVSKSAESGEYLPAGSFMIRGKKNFINPLRMEMGMTILYKIDDSCISKHLNDRKPKQDLDDLESLSSMSRLSIVHNQSITDNNNEKETVSITNTKEENKPMVLNKQQLINKAKEEQKNQQNLKNQKGGKKGQQQKEEEVEEKIIDQMPRGKKTKLKKLEKYKDQDEDERKLKLALLGSKEMVVYDMKKIQQNKQERHQKQLEQSEQYRQNAKQKREQKKLQNQKSDIQDEKQNNYKDKLNQMNHQEKSQKKDITSTVENNQQINSYNKQNEEKVENNKQNVENNKQNVENNKQNVENNKQNVENNKQNNCLYVENNQLINDNIQQIDCQKQQETDDNKQDNNQEDNKIIQNDLQNIDNNQQNENNEKKEDVEQNDSDNEPEEKIEYEDENEEQDNQKDSITSQLNQIIGKPLDDDVFYHLIPMIAPYQSLVQNYKFKAKIVPGNLKKGKAAKAALSLFMSSKDASEIEKKMMRQLSDLDLVNNMIGNAKIQGAGIQKLKDKEKAEKKKLKKQNE